MFEKSGKILIVSDTHRHHKNLDLVLGRVGKLDMLIHLGDAEGQEDYIEAVADCPIQIVAGNNDFFTMLKKEDEFFIGRHHVFITHGHNYYVSLGSERIRQEGVERNADIVMYGHTHRPMIEYFDHLTILNPGSLSFPRQEGRKGSYILMDIDTNGDAHFTLNFV